MWHVLWWLGDQEEAIRCIDQAMKFSAGTEEVLAVCIQCSDRFVAGQALTV
jgi:hypothetical protein